MPDLTAGNIESEGGAKPPAAGADANLPTDGIVLVQPFASWVAQGKKTVIIKSKPFDISGRPHLLITGDEALAVIELAPAEKINLKEFAALEPAHLITDEQRREFWPGKTEFWSYKVSSLAAFAKPLKIQRPQGPQVIIRDVVFAGDVVSMLDISKADEETLEAFRAALGRLVPLLDSWARSVLRFLTKPAARVAQVREAPQIARRLLRVVGGRPAAGSVSGNVADTLRDAVKLGRRVADFLGGMKGANVGDQVRSGLKALEAVDAVIPELMGMDEIEKDAVAAFVFPDAKKHGLDKKLYPGLKMPAPGFNVGRLKEDKSTGLFSRIARAGRVGVEQVLVNELNKPDDKPFAYAIVTMAEGRRFQGIGTVPKAVLEGVDEFTRREFQAEKDIWYHPIVLIRAFEPPIQMTSPVPGRRYASDVDVSDGAAKPAEKVDSPPRMFAVGADGAVREAEEFDRLADDAREVYALILPGAKAPWRVMPLEAESAEAAFEEAGRRIAERQVESGGLAKRVGISRDGEPVFNVVTLLCGFDPKVIAEGAIAEASSGSLDKKGKEELERLRELLRGIHDVAFAGTDATTYEGISREDVVNAYILVLEELAARGFQPVPTKEIDSEAKDLNPEVYKAAEVKPGEKPGGPADALCPWCGYAGAPGEGTRCPACHRSVIVAGKPKDEEEGRTLAPTCASGEKAGRRIFLYEVLQKIKPFRFRQDSISIVGGLANRGFTDNDIDVLIKGPLDENTRHVLRFRIGRMLGPELAERVQFLEDEFGGPFTNNVPLGHLSFETIEPFTVKEMRAPEECEKQDDPLQDMPAKPGPREAVVQLHFRGKSAHLDFRISLNGHLVGWTMAVQRPGAIKEPITSVAEARKIAAGYTAEDGNEYLKPFVAPDGLFATPKARQPKVWLEVEDEKFDPGSVGATRNFPAVWIVLDRPKVEFGQQSPRFHEYFITGSKLRDGIWFFRLLTGETPADAVREEEEGRVTPAGGAFWKFAAAKSYLPSMLKPRTAERGSMPPSGWSWLPESLERDVPADFRYWERRSHAEQTRDALVDAKVFTEGSVRLVDGAFRVVRTKSFVTAGDGQFVEAFPLPGKGITAKAAVDYTLSRQSFRGPVQVREGFSEVFWWLVIDDAGSGVRAWKLLTDPLAGEQRIAAIKAPANLTNDKALLKLTGEQKPGSRFNPTKDTPSDVFAVGDGKVDVQEEGQGFFRLRFTSGPIKGARVLAAEEKGSDIWDFSHAEPAERSEKLGAIPVRDGVQVWDPARKQPDADRTELKPLAIFAPMKPGRGFFDPDALLRDWITPELVKSGLDIEPKWNGIRVIAESDGGDGVLIYFEDSREDRSAVLPGVAGEVKALGKKVGPFVLDAELLDYDGEEALPRRTLARFTGGNPQDDSGVRLQVFRMVYGLGKNWTTTPRKAARPALEEFFQKAGKPKHLALSPTRAVRSVEDVPEGIRWAADFSGSEGAMFKLGESTYTLGGVTDSWTKLKLPRTVYAKVYDITRKTPSPAQRSPSRTFVYECAVGPVAEKEVDKYQATVRIGDRQYVPIGKTFATNVQAKVGDVLQVEVTELLVDLSNEKRTIHWFTPVVEAAAERGPHTAGEVVALAFPHEIKRPIEKLLEREIPIFKSVEERIVYGVVLEPETVDAQKDVYSAEEIRQAAHRYMEEFRHLGLMHKFRMDGRIRILESYIAPCDIEVEGQKVKKGTWLLVTRIVDDALWAAVKSGKLTGFSIGGSAMRDKETGKQAA